ncbi:MAG: hypothetical protein LBH43_07830, partial [Treponema sp.]|nr:hypothetical protein [Treponema sp.]
MVAKNDRAILRDLAKRVSEIANLDVMGLRREKWRLHNDLKTKEPLILVNPEGAFAELIPYSALRCEGDEARNIEWNLTSRIYYHENIDDDSVISDDFFVEKRLNGIGAWNAIDVGLDWGLKGKLERTPDSPQGAYRIEPVINNIDDIQKLKIPSLSYDGKATLADMEEKQELFGDILNVRIKGITHIMFHVMYFYIHYRGLEQMFFDLHDEPEFARELIGFFVAGYESILEQCVELNAFDLNNGSTPVATGGFGNTGELPKKDFSPDKVRLCDLWACAESQEMHPASPEMTEEFVICHERRLLSKFGLASYG